MDATTARSAAGGADRFFSLDGTGKVLRATWRPAHGFVNVSLWRDDRCVETFHLAPVDAGDLIAFLARSLAAVAPAPVTAPDERALRVVSPPDPSTTDPGTDRASFFPAGDAVRRRLADVLEHCARQLRQ